MPFGIDLEKRRRGAVRIAVRAHRLVWNFVPTLPGMLPGSHHTRVRSTVLEAVIVATARPWPCGGGGGGGGRRRRPCGGSGGDGGDAAAAATTGGHAAAARAAVTGVCARASPLASPPGQPPVHKRGIYAR